MEAGEHPQAGNVCLFRDSAGVVHLRHCITSESWQLSPGEWQLLDLEGGECELREDGLGKRAITSKHFRMKVITEDGVVRVRFPDGRMTLLRAFLGEHTVKYDSIVGFGTEGRFAIKAYVLLRGSRCARVFLELFDIVRALGADDKKSQKGRQFVLNIHSVWQSCLVARGIPRQHIRKGRPRTSSPPPSFDPSDPWEDRIFDEAAASFMGAIVLLCRYWEPKVRKSAESAAADSLLSAICSNYLPQEWQLTIVFDSSWPVPWGGEQVHGWAEYECTSPMISLSVVSGVVDLSALHAAREGVAPASECAMLCSALGNASCVDLLELLKPAWLCRDLLWFLRQLLWQLHSATGHGFTERPGVTDPLYSPRGRGAAGSRHDQCVVQAAVTRRRNEFHRESAREALRLHPTAHLSRQSRHFRRGEECFLKRYLAAARGIFSATRHLHIAADSSRVGGKNTEFVAVWSAEGQIVAWCPPQDIPEATTFMRGRGCAEAV